jgi:hypothetical protein
MERSLSPPAIALHEAVDLRFKAFRLWMPGLNEGNGGFHSDHGVTLGSKQNR